MAHMGKEKMMNKAESSVHKAGGDKREKPAASRGRSEVGNETRPDMHGALEGRPTDKNPLHGAMRELHKQHPHKHDDLGPHHGEKHHIRHEPLHGLKPARRG